MRSSSGPRKMSQPFRFDPSAAQHVCDPSGCKRSWSISFDATPREAKIIYTHTHR